MNLADKVLAVNNDLPIRTDAPVHSGKVRSVYWLTEADSKRLIAEKGYNVASDTPLAIMVISDRISAFDCIWRGEGNMQGVPGKGAALNAISNHWFKLFNEQGLAESHILDIPHPFVWIVQKAKPVMIEAMSYRLGAHSTSDDPSGYRTREEEAKWQAHDPILRMKNWMLANNWWDEDQETALFERLREKVLAAVKVAEKIDKPPVEDLVTDVYDQVPHHLEQQLTELKHHIKKYPDSYPFTAGRIK